MSHAGREGREGGFPATQVSVVGDLASDEPARRERAVALVMGAYRGAVIAVLRRQWSLAEDAAEDLAHDFFAQALAREWLSRYDPARGRFRTFLRACLQAFAATAHEARTRQKRAGSRIHIPLDDATSPATDPEIDRLFDREWARSVLDLSVAALRADCDGCGRRSSFELFLAYDIEGADQATPPTYAELAARFDLPGTQVTNFLNWARRRFRAHVLETLRGLTASDAEYREEARRLLGVEVT